MKKLLFVAALGVAGLMSAKSEVVNNNHEKEKQEQKESAIKEQKVQLTCKTFNLSCGGSEVACAKDTETMLEVMWFLDGVNCG
ncbi:MAG: hypothetical protein QM564_04200 [Bergeyella sp.]